MNIQNVAAARYATHRHRTLARKVQQVFFALGLAACGASADDPSGLENDTLRIAAALPDVVVTSLSYSSATGTFSSIVKNKGVASTPSGVAIGVAYYSDSVYRTWGSVNGPLLPGASVVIGTNGGAFNVASGTHTIRAWVDDINRFSESHETNNQRSALISVGSEPVISNPPPVISNASPSGALSAGTTSTSMAATTDESATCKWGTTDTIYGSLPNTFAVTGGTSHSTTVSGLVDGQSYAFYVRCLDAAGNADASSTVVSFRVGTPPSATFLWHDAIQGGGAAPWGFSGMEVEHPIGTAVSPSDANGANLSRVADPFGVGFAMRHFSTFDESGSRSQAGLWSFDNAAFGNQAKSAEGVWIAQEWYFPQRITAGGDIIPWVNLWDWHSTDSGGANRWHTSPGLMLVEDGSMKVRWEWGGPAGSINPSSADSTISLPVGQWFDVEMYYKWTTGTTTLSLWINGVLALQQSGVQTRAASHTNVETYSKFYGSSNGGTAWSPTPSVRYTRNVRVANERIWH